MFKEIQLSGTCFSDLNTEVRFAIAEARSCGTELVKLIPPLAEQDEYNRAINCLKRVLRAMMRSGRVQFFIQSNQLSTGETEAEFLLNKYGPILEAQNKQDDGLFVKI